MNRIVFLGLLACLSGAAPAAVLTKGVPQTALGAAAGQTLSYTLALPAGASNLQIKSSGGTGDADLYVRKDSAPTSSAYDCRPYESDSNETCSFAAPANATYYINLKGYSSFSGVSLVADYALAASGPTALSNGVSVGGIAAATGSGSQYVITVPAGASNLSITTSGGSGASDLYVRFGSAPSTTTYDCRPYLNGNNETCSFSSPPAGTYYILLQAYQSYANVSLLASYTAASSGGNTGTPAGATWSGYASYYANAIGKSGTALRAALNEAAARSHTRMSYSQVWEAIKYTDEDPANSSNVLLIYTGRSQAKTFNASSSSDPDAWNREHCWPKSHGFSSESQWAHTDIHHLRPADISVNSTRGNKDYDLGGSQIGEAPGNYTDADSFEPRNAVKGDLARMMFYMAIRYEGGDGTGVGDLELVNTTGSSGIHQLGKLCSLLQWHRQDPVSPEEIARHARIVERQGNRNPFVDYPAWADQLFAASCN